MRPSLLNKVQSAICVKCRLPNCTENIDKTLLTTDEDYCLENPKSEELSQIIYNGIVEYAVNEFKIDYSNLSLEQAKVIVRDMKYDSVVRSDTENLFFDQCITGKRIFVFSD